MPDTLLHEKIAQEVHEAGNAGRKARADSEAESRENEKTVCTRPPLLSRPRLFAPHCGEWKRLLLIDDLIAGVRSRLMNMLF